MFLKKHLYTLLLILVATLETFSFAPSSLSIGVLLLFFLIDKNIVQKLKNSFSNPLMWVFCSYVFLQVLGLIHTENITQGIKEIKGVVLLVIVPMVLYGEKLDAKQLQILFQFFIAFLILFAFFLLYIDPINMQFKYGIHIMPLSNYFIVGILLCLYLWEQEKLRWYFLLPLVLLFSLLILKLSSRISFIILSLLSLCYLIYRKYWKTLIFTFFTVSTGFFYFSQKEQLLTIKFKQLIENYKGIDELFVNGKVQNEKVDGHGEERLIFWYLGWRIFKQNPLIGVGTGDTKDAIYESYKNVDFKLGIQEKYEVHNQYIAALMKLGIFGFVALLGIFVTVFLRAIKTRNHLLLMLLINTLLTAFTESIFGQYHCILIFAFFIPLLDLSKKTTS